MNPSRYSSVAIALHWSIALLLIAQIALGYYISIGLAEAPGPVRGEWIGIHKPLGLLVLVLTLARIGWRLTHKPPPYPAHVKDSGIILAKLVHAGFYILLLALPISGWIMVSSAARAFPIDFFGLFDWPFFPGVQGLDPAAKEAVRDIAVLWHREILVWATLLLIALHVAGALRHHLKGYPLIKRMLPGRGAPR